MTEWEKEISKQAAQSEQTFIAGLSAIYDSIRSKSKVLSSKWREASPDANATAWLNSRGRNVSLQKDISTLSTDYLKADSFINARYKMEYASNYYREAYATVQLFREKGYSVAINKYTAASLEKAILNPLSKYTQPKILAADRAKSMQKIYNTVRQGVIQSTSLQNINKLIDVDLGYRDKLTGKLIAKPVNYKGDFYNRSRVLRTEIGRIRSTAATAEWLTEQDMGIESDLVYSAILDNRTRSQSASMDGQKANEEGMFLYPDGGYYFQKSTGTAAWDINDRCTTVTILANRNIEDYAVRREIKNKPSVVPYQTFDEYATDRGMTQNKYGQYYF